MGISLLGIVAVQVYWFNNSVNVRNELFDRSVNEAMNKAVRRLETGNDLKIIRGISGADTIRMVEGFAIPPPPPPPIPDIEDLDVVVKRDSVHRVVKIITSNPHQPKQTSVTFQMDANHSKRANKAILTEDFYGQVPDSMVILDIHTNYDNSKSISQKMKQLKSLTNQLNVEYKGWMTGRSVDEVQLKKILVEELADRDIPIDFNFSINGRDSIPFKEIKNSSIYKWYKVNLFPNDIFRKNLELALYFPAREEFIGEKTTRLMGLSVVFTLIIFFTFLWSIYLIIKQKKISEMKSDFINNMTHEFKTPIATISIAADSLTNDKVIGEADKVRFFAGMIRKENRRMNEQVERILQIARFDRKEFEFNFQSTDVHQIILDAVNGILLQVEQRGGSIETGFDATNPYVTTDPIHFSNLVYNLLDNANKYSPEAPEIKVRTANNGRGILLTVEDSGIGMTKAVQSRIFDKFYRLPSGNIHNVKGFGLGLSYVRAILDANGGTIKVSSDPGKGSRFTVFVPFQINHR